MGLWVVGGWVNGGNESAFVSGVSIVQSRRSWPRVAVLTPKTVL